MSLPRHKGIKCVLIGLMVLLSLGANAADRESYLVTIQTLEGKQIVYKLQLAATPAARRQGLMFRQELLDREGMLFVWPQEDNRSFWMKNTPVSLDILFFSHEKILVSSHQNTVPFSVVQLPSGKKAQYVVELKAGQAQLQGFKLGSSLILSDGLMRALDR